MSRARESDIADIGYKIQVNDYIVMTTSFNMEKAFRVTHVAKGVAYVKIKNRHYLKFNRYYHLPFKPLANEHKPNRWSRYEWTVRVNDINVKKRLKL